MGACITMFILPSVGCNENTIILLIIINMLTQGFVAAGEYPLLNEYSGNYSGTVYGIAITFDSLARFIAPIIRGELVKTAVRIRKMAISLIVSETIFFILRTPFPTGTSFSTLPLF